MNFAAIRYFLRRNSYFQVRIVSSNRYPNLYCTPVKLAVNPDCSRQQSTFTGCFTVNPGGLQYKSGRTALWFCAVLPAIVPAIYKTLPVDILPHSVHGKSDKIHKKYPGIPLRYRIFPQVLYGPLLLCPILQ